jgi:hypothetical protein
MLQMRHWRSRCDEEMAAVSREVACPLTPVASMVSTLCKSAEAQFLISIMMTMNAPTQSRIARDMTT